MVHNSFPTLQRAVLASVVWMTSGEFVKFVGKVCMFVVNFGVIDVLCTIVSLVNIGAA